MDDITIYRIARFWSGVDRSAGPNGCWPWTRAVFKVNGYGQATTIKELGGSPDTLSTTAHRQAWLIECGDPGTYVNARTGKTHKHKILHRCPGGPNRLCCNPAHLAIGTDQDNADDRGHDGNQAHGERMGSAKLTEQDVIQIRALHGKGAGVTELARQFKVAHGTIGPIVRRQTWKHV